jgi:riboflavin kinase
MKFVDKKKTSEFFMLFEIAKLGALEKTIKLTSVRIGEIFAFSQQTSARKLRNLEQFGWISREIVPKGQLIRITKEGREVLQKVYSNLSILFVNRFPPVVLEGEVFTGLGEGSYYVQKEGYLKQFTEQLGFTPYPGTLNLRLRSKADINAKQDLSTVPHIPIEGWSNGQRTYGPVKLYRTMINNKVRGALLDAERSHYGEDVVEIIAPEFLRKILGLKDGDIVQLLFI